MQLVTCSIGAKAFLGAQLDSWVVDLKTAYIAYAVKSGQDEKSFETKIILLTDMLSLLRGGGEALSLVRETLEFAEVQISSHEISDFEEFIYLSADLSFLPPLLRPGKIICVGLNYPDREPATRGIHPEYPVLFHKVATSLVGNNQPIVIPRIANRILYEGELVIVIGRLGKHIPKEETESYIAGYTIANDVGAPDLENRTSQWTTGKMLDTFCPLGPALVTRDEIPAVNNLWIRTSLNGVVVQYGNTGDMYFDIPFLVSYISELVTLEPGDLILSGSPKKSGMQPDPRTTMVTGDTVTVEITGLGKLTNHVVAEE